MRGVELAHPDLEARMDAYLAARAWSWQQLQRGDCKAGDLAIGIDELQVFLIDSDPVLWMECNLLDKDKGDGTPYRAFDYQKSGARYLGDCCFECASGVGKTYDIVGITLWHLFGHGLRPRGSSLIAASLDGNLEDIYDLQDWQLTNNPHLYEQMDWDKCLKKPYRKLVAKNGNKIDYRPAGNDGKALRGVHATQIAVFEEAAKSHEKQTWGEFWRSMEPTCYAKIYSVPDGVTSSPFFRLCRRATPIDPLAPPTHGNLPGVEVASSEDKVRAFGRRERVFVKFCWSKTMMPAEFWNPERKAGLIEQFGGEDTAEYQQNVLGKWGDPASTLWPWSLFSPNLKYVPEFRELDLRWNRDTQVIHAIARRLNPSYEAAANRPGDESDAGSPSVTPMVEIFEQEFDFGNLDLGQLIRRVFGPLPGHIAMGYDCGSESDPSVISGLEQRGDRMRHVVRVSLRHFDYSQQQAVAMHLDQVIRPSLGWGLDATGVGTAFEHYLVAGTGDWSLAGRLSGYIANVNVENRDPESGEPILDEGTDKVKTISAKEFGTILLERDIQQVNFELAATPPVTEQFPQYKSRKTKTGGRTFDSTNDHDIDAIRVARHRIFDVTFGELASGPIEYAVPSGMSRPSLEID